LEASGYFASRNPNKKSFALNMSKPEARQIALDLASTADAVTSNFRPGVMEKWGLSYDEVHAVKPEVIYMVMPMQGSDGPHRSFIGFGSTIAALGGLVQLSGEPGRIPVGTGTHYPDHVPNPGHSLVAILAAMFHRARGGHGQRVESSQFESTVNMIGPAILAASAGQETRATGNRAPGIAPRGAYQTADGHWVVISCATDHQWSSLASEMSADGLEFGADTARVAEREARQDDLDAALAGWVSKLDRSDVLRRLQAAGVPAGPVNNSADLLADQNLNERGFWQWLQHPVIGEMPMFTIPFMRDGGNRTMSRPPLLGEHTWDVASSLLGMPRDRYEELVEAEILY
jgi:benzylsuccinate CoA-transferase BbsF subunit